MDILDLFLFVYIQGDSGGPIVCKKGIIAGIIVRGSIPCNNPKFPQVFTNIGFYRNWIDKTIQKYIV